MSIPTSGVFALTADAEWEGTKAIRFQIDGNDLVSVTGIDPQTGQAEIIVYASTHPDADVVWRGAVNILAHEQQ